MSQGDSLSEICNSVYVNSPDVRQIVKQSKASDKNIWIIWRGRNIIRSGAFSGSEYPGGLGADEMQMTWKMYGCLGADEIIISGNIPGGLGADDM